MILVTGGAGFIGSNLIHALNGMGERDILVVDNLTNGSKQRNLANVEIQDYIDKNDFVERGGLAPFRKVRAVFHIGACSSTTESDGRYMMRNNYEYSKTLLAACQAKRIPFLYASSASVYGNGDNGFSENRASESPLNVYAYSKFLFDQLVRRQAQRPKSQVVGLRFFNVFGPQENHKGKMASVIFHFFNQVLKDNEFSLFEGSEGFKRDFVSVDDVVKIALHFYKQPELSGIFNVGTGKAESFEALAAIVQEYFPKAKKKSISFPAELQGKYQTFTQADLTRLRNEGRYESAFQNLRSSVWSYLELLSKTGGYLGPSRSVCDPKP